jgi:hypothetical protein
MSMVNEPWLFYGVRMCEVEITHALQHVSDGHESPPKQAVEMRVQARGLMGFTIEGGIVVVANALLHAAAPIGESRYHVLSSELGQNSAVLNGMLWTGTVLLQSALDSFASLCQKISQLPQAAGYFHNYPFINSDIVWVGVHQTKIAEILFDGKTFDEFANFIKHEQPWIGAVSMGATGTRDVCDSSGVGYVYGVLIPVFKELKLMVCRLAKQYGQPVPVYPQL